mgnify:CR=1 FL=1
MSLTELLIVTISVYGTSWLISCSNFPLSKALRLIIPKPFKCIVCTSVWVAICYWVAIVSLEEYIGFWTWIMYILGSTWIISKLLGDSE